MLIVVPARAGSKGLPGKNTATFCSAPLVAWSFAAARVLGGQIKGADIVCSSDDPTVLEIATGWPGIVAHERPAELATDQSGMAGVVLDARRAVAGNHQRYLLLQPTSPLRVVADLEQFAGKAQGDGALVSVTPPAESPEDIIALPACRPLAKDNAVRRQDRAGRYGFVDGSLYAGDFTDLENGTGFLPEGRTSAMMQALPRAVDIDAPLDWHMAQAMHAWLTREGVDLVAPGQQ